MAEIPQFGFNVLPYKSYEDISQLKRYSGGAVVLATYDFITEYYEPIKEMEWDLSVYEEAHRLRKYKIENNKTAEILHDTFANSKKILLTATPIQKNEMDIFGLINFIDETVFTDKDEFYKRYFRKPENYPELRSIIAPYTFRTLRSQVKADVKLPERIIEIFDRSVEIDFKNNVKEFLTNEDNEISDTALKNLSLINGSILDELYSVYIESDTYYTYDDICEEIVELFDTDYSDSAD